MKPKIWPPPVKIDRVIARVAGDWIEVSQKLGTFQKRPPSWEKFEPVILASHGCGCCSDDDPTPTHWIPVPQEILE